jgi:hypothetical protein
MSKAARLREVAVANPPLELLWVEPSSLDDNSLNFKIHTDFQTEVVSELIRKHGWIKPLVYNLETRRLIDGHDRKQIAVAQRLPFVPVVVGTWPEEQEPEILAALDASGALARTDPDSLKRLLEELEDPAPVIDRLITEMAESNGLLSRLQEEMPARVEPTFTPDAPPDFGERIDDFPPSGTAPADPPPIPHYQAAPSHVRMVQIYLDTETLPEFRRMVAVLQTRHGTETETDTVMAVMRRAYDEEAAGE